MCLYILKWNFSEIQKNLPGKVTVSDNIADPADKQFLEKRQLNGLTKARLANNVICFHLQNTAKQYYAMFQLNTEIMKLISNINTKKQ